MILPLKNIRVLDFGEYVAGPAAAMMLADQGAEVIRIDPPGGPVWDSPAMAAPARYVFKPRSSVAPHPRPLSPQAGRGEGTDTPFDPLRFST